MKAFVLSALFYACAASVVVVDIEGDLEGLRQSLHATCGNLVAKQDGDLDAYRENNRNQVRAAIQQANGTCADDVLGQVSEALDSEILRLDGEFENQKNNFEQLVGINIDLVITNLRDLCVDEEQCNMVRQVIESVAQTATCDEEVGLLVKQLHAISDGARVGLIEGMDTLCSADAL